jgi:L-threonylcarbamoyladenylate synthase
MNSKISDIVAALKQGDTILYPTDTIWGIGCDATNSNACKKIISLKQRTPNKSMLILVDSIAMLERYVTYIPDAAYNLIEVCETPLTIIYPQAKNIAPELIAADGSIGIRICITEFCQKLLNAFNKPIVSTSANFSGEKAPRNFYEIPSELKDQINYIVQISSDEILENKPSEIIKINKDNSIKIIRK